MASSASSAPVLGPTIPFKDDDNENDDADVLAAAPETPSEEHAGMVSTLPSCAVPGLRCYQGFWMPEGWIAAAAGLQRRFQPHPSDVIVASLLKSGTTWLVALTLATMARRAYPPGAADHPLRRLNPHRCVPFLEGLFADRREGKLEALPSPRLINTHMPLAMIPAAVPAAGSGGGGGGCRVVYVCREPKAMVVSLWHYLRRMYPELPFGDVFGMACDGTTPCGPFWDHILGYWRAGVAAPENVLFLRYEELLRDPAGNVRSLARFVGLPFTAAEEEGGVVGDIVELCSLDSLRGVEANRTGYMDPHGKLPREALFRKGVADDWRNHMTPEMARRMDDIVAVKFRATGLTFL